MTEPRQEKILLQALKGEKTERIPFWFMRQAGRYLPEYREIRAQMGGFLDLVFTPEKAAEVTLQPIRRFGMDGAILFSDILVIPYSLGQKVTFKDGIGPVLDPLKLEEDKFGLSEEKVGEKLAPIYRTIRLVREKLPQNVTLIGFAGSPWTVATYMVEGKGTPEKTETLKFSRENPERFQALIDLIVKTTILYLKGQVAAGVEALQLFDSWAGALEDEETFRKWSIEPTKKIVAAMKEAAPHIPLVGFPKGAGDFYKPYLMETGLDAVNLDYDIDLDWAARELKGLGCLQGNLDPKFLVNGGEGLMVQTEKILKKLGEGPFVFNLGHGIVPQTPPENVEKISAFLKTRTRS